MPQISNFKYNKYKNKQRDIKKPKEIQKDDRDDEVGIGTCCEVCMKNIREKQETSSPYVAYLTILLYRF